MRFEQARQAVGRATDVVKGAVHAREEARRSAEVTPTPAVCRTLDAAATVLDDAWQGLIARYGELIAAAAPYPDRGALARAGRRRSLEQARAERTFAERWRARCAALPAVARMDPVAPSTPIPLCDGLVAHGTVLHDAGADTDRLRAPLGGLYVARRLAARLADEVDFLFILVHGGLEASEVVRAGAWLDLPPGAASRAQPFPRVPRSALPRWRRLRAAIVLDGAAGLRRSPSLWAIARTFANRLELPGCSPQFDGHWGYADVGGQLGGARPGGLRELSPGRWGLDGPGDRGPGLVANGGNAVPFAPLELHLMGLLPPSEVPPVTFLRNPRPDDCHLPDDASAICARADGTCRLDASSLAAGSPIASRAWRMAVVVVAPGHLDGASIEQYRRDLLAFTRPGPDDEPRLFNFYEATGGRARLEAIVPAVRPGVRACGASAALLP